MPSLLPDSINFFSRFRDSVGCLCCDRLIVVCSYLWCLLFVLILSVNFHKAAVNSILLMAFFGVFCCFLNFLFIYVFLFFCFYFLEIFWCV